MFFISKRRFCLWSVKPQDLFKMIQTLCKQPVFRKFFYIKFGFTNNNQLYSCALKQCLWDIGWAVKASYCKHKPQSCYKIKLVNEWSLKYHTACIALMSKHFTGTWAIKLAITVCVSFVSQARCYSHPAISYYISPIFCSAVVGVFLLLLWISLCLVDPVSRQPYTLVLVIVTVSSAIL